jgi:hypothetical protein
MVKGAAMSVTIRSSQKVFTETEVSGLAGVSPEHLRSFARSKHLGFLGAAAAAGEQAGKWLFTSADVMVLMTLLSHCEH